MLNRYFTSSSTNKIDAKGRVSIPVPFRKVLETEAQPGLVLIPKLYGEPCIDGLGAARYARIAAAIDRMSPFDPKARALRQKYFGLAFPTPIEEATGRIGLAKEVRDVLGDTEELLFVGLGESFQIWNPATFAAHQSTIDTLAAEAFPLLPWDNAGGAGA
jgi:MraZ protein